MDSALIVVATDIVSNPQAVKGLVGEYSKKYDVHQQLLERVEVHAVSLPQNYFTLVHVATNSGAAKVSGDVAEQLWACLKPGGSLNGDIAPQSKANLIIAGLVRADDGSYKKLDTSAVKSTEINLKRGHSATRALPKFQKAPSIAPLTPDELDEDDDDDLIDENSLVASAGSAIKFPAKCDPGSGRKRRRACKDCTCGLKEIEEQEQDRLRASQNAVVLNDLAEIDFTVPGKAVGGCGSCALGDAFRCDGCPYLGLPPFKPGEVVSIDSFGDDF